MIMKSKVNFAFELIGKAGSTLSDDLVVNAGILGNSKYETGIAYNGTLPTRELDGRVDLSKENFTVEVWITSSIEHVIYTVYPVSIITKVYLEKIRKGQKNIIHVIVDDIPAKLTASGIPKTQRKIIIEANHPF